MRLPKPKKIIAPKYEVGRSLFNRKIVKIKLSANESALGPSPKAVREYNKVSRNFKRYPDTNGNVLKSIIAHKFKIDKKRIILGSGSDQIFEFVCNAFINKGDEVIVPKYSFIIYRIYSKINGAKIIYAREKNFTISVKDILSKVTKRTKLVFLANPNNPTGTYISKKDLLYLRKKLRDDILLVVDDAYFEYLNQKDYLSGLKLFSGYKNVLVTRTFSKVYGLAGLRIGWGYASKKIINALNAVKPPFNVNRPALFAASAAIKDIRWLKKEINHTRRWNKILFEKFKEMKIATNESKLNFLLLNFDRVNISSKKVFQKLAKAGILVRTMNIYGIKNSLRITIGNNYENKKLISTLTKILNV
tara:strand:+ start:17 stop:1099 length:1083 start_codon:yes stop_codon:yes gene_type:complete